MITDQIKQLIDVSTLICTHMSSMITIEQQKREALLKYDIETTKKLMQNQQALVMQLDIMEKKRIAIQMAAGYSSMTSHAILDSISEDEKILLAPIFDQLRFLAKELQALNKVSLDIATTELRLMGVAPASSSGGLYQANGKKRFSSFGGSSFQETF